MKNEQLIMEQAIRELEKRMKPQRESLIEFIKYYFEDEKLGHGLNNTLKGLEENRELLDKIRDMCYNVIVNKTVMVAEDEQVTEEELFEELID